MAFKIFAGVVAITLFVAYVLPYVFKMKDIALGIVILAGIAMMLVELWQSVKSKED